MSSKKHVRFDFRENSVEIQRWKKDYWSYPHKYYLRHLTISSGLRLAKALENLCPNIYFLIYDGVIAYIDNVEE